MRFVFYSDARRHRLVTVAMVTPQQQQQQQAATRREEAGGGGGSHTCVYPHLKFFSVSHTLGCHPLFQITHTERHTHTHVFAFLSHTHTHSSLPLIYIVHLCLNALPPSISHSKASSSSSSTSPPLLLIFLLLILSSLFAPPHTDASLRFNPFILPLQKINLRK